MLRKPKCPLCRTSVHVCSSSLETRDYECEKCHIHFDKLQPVIDDGKPRPYRSASTATHSPTGRYRTQGGVRYAIDALSDVNEVFDPDPQDYETALRSFVPDSVA